MQISEEEHMIIHYFILLPLVKKVLERDVQLFEHGAFKVKDPYVGMIQDALRMIHHDMRRIKRYMYQRRITVTFKENDGMFSRYHYTCGGYEGSSSYLNANLKRQTRNCMNAYFHNTSPLQSDSILHY
ncbi:hypothetical protein SAMN05192534_1168 [Alteribacillus persepolensis]|uniref:Uncharacterized protein n=1 Tax=Alteribacillus persepolensis TaxID=568899 RepID=A0A1G8GJF8_9BACI|nr:hypothetical protein [Alteribacillus persepolensis]SDH94466.1 hypothetical protein SAMN05192534_1168 [Alteribacillus persepolensis]